MGPASVSTVAAARAALAPTVAPFFAAFALSDPSAPAVRVRSFSTHLPPASLKRTGRALTRAAFDPPGPRKTFCVSVVSASIRVALAGSKGTAGLG